MNTSKVFENLVISDKCKTPEATEFSIGEFENLVISDKCKTAKNKYKTPD